MLLLLLPIDFGALQLLLLGLEVHQLLLMREGAQLLLLAALVVLQLLLLGLEILWLLLRDLW
jgi:hypothetical protein